MKKSSFVGYFYPWDNEFRIGMVIEENPEDFIIREAPISSHSFEARQISIPKTEINRYQLSPITAEEYHKILHSALENNKENRASCFRGAMRFIGKDWRELKGG